MKTFMKLIHGPVAGYMWNIMMDELNPELETFWYRLTQVHLENGHYNGERD